MLYQHQQPAPPESLSSIQYWFAKIITQPYQHDAKIPAQTPEGHPIATEAAKYIAPSLLKPYERIEIYHQQYWWRLISTMKDTFPVLVRMFGHKDFENSIIVPYLTKYPLTNWSLSTIGLKLPQWIMEEYHQSDQMLVYHAAVLDELFTSCFICKSYPALNAQEIVQKGGTDSLLSTKLYLQPHIRLFAWDYDLIAYRQAFLNESIEYWTENDFPILDKTKKFSFVFFRGHHNNIYWQEVHPAQFALIRLFQNGASIEEACEMLENENEEIFEEAIKNLQKWFHQWSTFAWFTIKNPD